jgi:hypothetical protein
MPTVRPRRQITETPALARAIDQAARLWPGESGSKLLLLLVDAGCAALEKGGHLATSSDRKPSRPAAASAPTPSAPTTLAYLRLNWPK